MEAPQILPFLSTVLVIVMVRLKAEQKGQLRDGNVPCVPGFMEWTGLKAKNLYADYEFLYSRHHQYFSSSEEVKAAIEMVLAKPEQVKDKGKIFHLSALMKLPEIFTE